MEQRLAQKDDALADMESEVHRAASASIELDARHRKEMAEAVAAHDAATEAAVDQAVQDVETRAKEELERVWASRAEALTTEFERTRQEITLYV